MNANEWRAKDNENPIGEQGDLYLVPGGFASLDKVKDAPPPGSKAASGNGGSDNASANNQSLPSFDRGQIINAVDRAIGPRRNIVRGASLRARRPSVRARQRRLIKSMALEQLQEAVDRINAVLDNEQERLVAKGSSSARCIGIATSRGWKVHCSTAARLTLELAARSIHQRWRPICLGAWLPRDEQTSTASRYKRWLALHPKQSREKMSDKKSHVRLTQVPSVPRMPVVMDASKLQQGQVDAMKLMRKVDRQLQSVDANGLLGSIGQAGPRIDGLLD